MSNETGMLALLQERERQLQEQLKNLEQRANELRQQDDKQNTSELNTINSEIKKVDNEIKEIKKDIEKAEERSTDIETKFEAIDNISEPLKIIDEKQIEEKTQHTFTEVGISQKSVIDTQQLDMQTAAIAATGVALAVGGKVVNELVNDTKEYLSAKFLEKDAAKEWGNDIDKKETALNESHESKLQTLEHNNVMQESQLKDAKKEGYEEKLVELDKTIETERENINNKFEKEIEKIVKEKDALENAIDSTKELEGAERNKEIEKQRQEFERQQQIERQKLNDSLNR